MPHRRRVAPVAVWLSLFAGAASGQIATHVTRDQGPLLVGELNCVACHTADAAIAQRILPNPTPLLTDAGRRITPQYLRAFLSDPHQAKPGTRMPNALHALPQQQREHAVEALTHFLLDQGEPPVPTAAASSEAMIRHGERLYHSIGCVACHAPIRPPPQGPEDDEAPTQIPALTRPSVPLGDQKTKTTLDALAAFLLDPLKVRPGGRMPSLKLTPTEARAIAAYLLREQADKKRPAAAPGLTFAFYEGQWLELQNVAKSGLRPRTTGTVDAPRLDMLQPQLDFAVTFTGNLDVPADGKYAFTFTGRDAVQLSIDGKNAGLRKGGKDGRVFDVTLDLTRGVHAFELIVRQQGGTPTLDATWRRPGDKAATAIPAFAFTHDGFATRPAGAGNFKPDPDLAKKGRDLFATAGCASCHTIDGVPPALATPLAKLDLAKRGSCIDATVSPGRPAYAVDDAQRAALRGALTSLKSTPATGDDKQLAHHTMAAMNCYACHTREGAPGPDKGRLPYFTPLIDIDLGDEGRLPPHLNEAGAKFTVAGFEKVLFEGLSVRPYLATRMPQFGKGNLAHLLAALAKSDAGKVPPAVEAPKSSLKLIDDGRRLVGTQGLGCVNCHGWGRYKSLGAPAVNLLATPPRLTREYVHAYLADPAKYRPGTRMPAFWTDGENALKEVQGGDVMKQVDAIWAYLSAGEKAGMPHGLSDGEQSLLVPTSEPIVFRTFVKEVGVHAIAIGFRQKSHVIFDALRVRTAVAWSGDFLRTSGAWTGRGGGYVEIPSKVPILLPPGNPLALLESQSSPWPTIDPKAKAAPTGWRFRGYRYAADRTPTLLYSFNNIEIEETPSAQYANTDKGGSITRTLRLKTDTPPQTLYFRAATGDRLEPQTDGTFLVDGKVRYRLKSAAAPLTRTTDDAKHDLLVPITWTQINGKSHADVEVEISW